MNAHEIAGDLETGTYAIVGALGDAMMAGAQAARQAREEKRIQGWVDYTAAEASAAGMRADLAQACADGLADRLQAARGKTMASTIEIGALEEEVDELTAENLALRKQLAVVTAEVEVLRRRTALHAAR